MLNVVLFCLNSGGDGYGDECDVRRHPGGDHPGSGCGDSYPGGGSGCGDGHPGGCSEW